MRSIAEVSRTVFTAYFQFPNRASRIHSPLSSSLFDCSTSYVRPPRQQTFKWTKPRRAHNSKFVFHTAVWSAACCSAAERRSARCGCLSPVSNKAMGQQQQQQPPQHLNPVVDPAKVMSAAAAPPAALMHCNPYSLDDASSSTCLAAQQAAARLLLNPWRELTPSDFVIGYARGVGRVRCSTCLSKITQGELQVREGGRASGSSSSSRYRVRRRTCAFTVFLHRIHATQPSNSLSGVEHTRPFASGFRGCPTQEQN